MPERPRVVAVLNPKGGSGKSTIAVNVACALHRRHGIERKTGDRPQSARILDTDDPQFSALRWGERSGEGKTLKEDAPKHPHVRSVKEDEKLAPLVQNRKELPRTSYIVIDGAGQITGKTGDAVHVADAVVIPVQPSPLDLWGVKEMLPSIRKRQKQTGGKPAAAFVVSQARAGTRLSGDVAEALEAFGLPIFEARTGHRVAYAESMAGGGSVLDRPGSKAAAEIEAITDELETLLNR